MPADISSRFERHALACLAFGVIGDAMGTPTENLEPAEIEQRFGWVDTFEGDGTDDTIMRDLIAAALIRTGGYANADNWAEEWRDQHQAIFGSKVGRFFPSVLHAAAKLHSGSEQSERFHRLGSDAAAKNHGFDRAHPKWTGRYRR